MGLTIVLALFAFEVNKFNGAIYRGIALIAGVSALRFLVLWQGGEPWVLFDFVNMILITTSGLYLGTQMFPNMGLFGPKKDELGNAKLE